MTGTGTPCRLSRTCWSRLVLAMLTAVATVAAAAPPPPLDPLPCYFAEPATGRKVLSYEVELAVNDEGKKTFSIPADCEAVNRAFDEGLAYKGSIMDRRFWMKVTSDCRYYQLLRRHPLRAVQDFVSDFDFQNTRLDLLPYDRGCPEIGDEPGAAGCSPTFVDPFGQVQQFPPVGPPPEMHPDGGEGCELRDGVFTGHIFADGHGLHCIPAEDAPSLRLVGVDFADINGDGYMDAILRFLPVGPGTMRRTLLLPVTRFSADGEFQVPLAR